MTLPKTHPLYGARNVLVDALYFLGIGSNRTEIEGIAETFVRDLESAGYRVVGPESVGVMAGGVPNPFVRKSMVEDMLSAAIAAAPTITGTEKSDE